MQLTKFTKFTDLLNTFTIYLFIKFTVITTWWVTVLFWKRKRCWFACVILALRPHASSWFSQNLPTAWKRYQYVVSASTVHRNINHR